MRATASRTGGPEAVRRDCQPAGRVDRPAPSGDNAALCARNAAFEPRTKDDAMNILLLVSLIILAYWIVGILWVASQKDWE